VHFDLLDRAQAERRPSAGRAQAERNPGLIYLNVEPVLANVRSHPRVARILKAMKFPASWVRLLWRVARPDYRCRCTRYVTTSCRSLVVQDVAV
jgi:hypothetical protein